MILVAGSANLDFVVRAPHIPAPGETVLGKDFRTFAGGKGANQAIASARAAGVATAMLLALGRDSFAEPIEASLRAAEIDLHIVRTDHLPTGTAFICVSDSAENAITVAPGANSALRAGHLPELTGVTHLLLQLETPLATVAAYAKAAREKGVTVVLNAAPAQALPMELLLLTDVLVVNEGELARISNSNSSGNGGASVAECLEQLPDVPCIVVTLGVRGCCARIGGQFILQPAFAITPVDSTAAGDTFCGVLVACLAQRRAVPEALRRASAAAALACMRSGAQDSIPSGKEVERFLMQRPTEALADTAATAVEIASLGAIGGSDTAGLNSAGVNF